MVNINRVNRCIAVAYDDDGFPKRTVGVFYPDMGCVYTREMLNSDRGIVDNDRKTKRKRNKRSVAGQKKK